jgi:hypothetical protein
MLAVGLLEQAATVLVLVLTLLIGVGSGAGFAAAGDDGIRVRAAHLDRFRSWR